MSWILIGVAALFGLGVAVVCVGFALPKELDSVEQIELSHPPQKVWEAIQEFELLPTSMSQVRSIEALQQDDGMPAWRVDIGPSVVTVKTRTMEAPQKLIRTMADSVVPMSATLTYLLKPTSAGTELRLEEATVIERGSWHVPLFRILTRLTRGMNSRMYLKALQRHLEG